MSAPSESRGGELLTRTTLETDDGLSLLAVAGLLQALRHVPGVLLADLVAGSGQTVVVHDGAVPSASLLAAAQSVGVQARICRADRPALAGVHAPLASTNGLLVIVADVVLLGALVSVFNPRLFGAPSLLFMALAAIWGGVVAGAILGRRT